jgi:hypothetical protein
MLRVRLTTTKKTRRRMLPAGLTNSAATHGRVGLGRVAGKT